MKLLRVSVCDKRKVNRASQQRSRFQAGFSSEILSDFPFKSNIPIILDICRSLNNSWKAQNKVGFNSLIIIVFSH